MRENFIIFEFQKQNFTKKKKESIIIRKIENGPWIFRFSFHQFS